MIGKASLFILVLILCIQGVGAQEIIEYSVDMEADRNLIYEDVTLVIRNNHDTVLRQLIYPFSGKVESLKTFDESGGLQSEVELRGKSYYVSTELRDPLGFNETASILYEFEDPSSVVYFNNTYFLSTSFPLLANVKKFDLTLKLPEGTGLKDIDSDVIPAPTDITSDGRVIILRWEENNPSDFRVFVKYEILLNEPLNNTTTTSISTSTTSSSTTSTTQLQNGNSLINMEEILLFLGILMALVLIFVVFMRFKGRSKIQEKIDILKEDEQLILKIVAEEDGIEQREIQRKTDFSKTKVSKILSELERREAIRKESMGKKNRIYLTQKLKE